MDLGFLEKSLAKLELKPDAMKGVIENCVDNGKGSEKEVARIFENEYQTHVIERKLAILQVISEILVVTGAKKETGYMKAMSAKLKNYFEEISK